jgi:Lrp/AsnC family transcriptional regulator for asnA, asnC and gidA
MTKPIGYALDALDISIMKHLEVDGRKSYSDIAEDLGVAVSTVSARVGKLLDRNILAIHAVLNPFEVGFEATAIINLTIDPKGYDEAVGAILEYPEVNFASMTSGDHNLIVDVYCRDAEHLSELLTQRLYKVKGVQDLKVTYQLKRLKLGPSGVELLEPEQNGSQR